MFYYFLYSLVFYSVLNCTDNSKLFHQFSDLPLELQLHIFDPHHLTEFEFPAIIRTHYYLQLTAKKFSMLKTIQTMISDLPFFLHRYCSGAQPFSTQEVAQILKKKIKPTDKKNEEARTIVKNFLKCSKEAHEFLRKFHCFLAYGKPNFCCDENTTCEALDVIFCLNPLVRVSSRFKWLEGYYVKENLQLSALPSVCISRLFDKECWHSDRETLAYNYKQFIDTNTPHMVNLQGDELYKKIGIELAQEAFIEKFMKEKHNPYTFIFHRNTLLHNYLEYVDPSQLNVDLIKKMIEYGIDQTVPNLLGETAISICKKRNLLNPSSKAAIDILLEQTYTNINYSTCIASYY